MENLQPYFSIKERISIGLRYELPITHTIDPTSHSLKYVEEQKVQNYELDFDSKWYVYVWGSHRVSLGCESLTIRKLFRVLKIVLAVVMVRLPALNYIMY